MVSATVQPRSNALTVLHTLAQTPCYQRLSAGELMTGILRSGRHGLKKTVNQQQHQQNGKPGSILDGCTCRNKHTKVNVPFQTTRRVLWQAAPQSRAMMTKPLTTSIIPNQYPAACRLCKVGQPKEMSCVHSEELQAVSVRASTKLRLPSPSI